MTTPQSRFGIGTLEKTLSYHEETKHHLERYARSLGYLKWADQPNPFREFQGAPRVGLPSHGKRSPPLLLNFFPASPKPLKL